MSKRIGEFLVERGLLNPADVETILQYASQRRMRFGEAGLELGLLTRDSMIRAFGPNFLVDFFHLDPHYFPPATKDIFPVARLIEWGALPLGYKTQASWFRSRRALNLGLLDPKRKDVVARASEEARVEDFSTVKVYLVLPNEFVGVLEQVYGIDGERLGAVRAEEMDATLRMFLELP